jgi:GH24 family phage-related lysozyme (muramidase)
MSKFKRTLMKDEGFRAEMYLDHLGFPTIGYGTRINELKVTKEEAERWLDAELDEKEERLRQIPEYAKLSINRKNVIRSMAYQMGVGGTKRFRNMWRAIARDDYVTAAEEMRDSQWWRDPATRRRADRMSRRMAADVWDLG